MIFFFYLKALWVILKKVLKVKMNLIQIYQLLVKSKRNSILFEICKI